MNILLKQILMAAGLIAFCVAIFAGVKSYGVWVISAVAVVLFVIGMLRKNKPDGLESKDGARERDRQDGT